MLRKVTAYIVFEDGSAQISESEMRRWIKEQSKKKVKSVEFLSAEKFKEIK